MSGSWATESRRRICLEAHGNKLFVPSSRSPRPGLLRQGARASGALLAVALALAACGCEPAVSEDRSPAVLHRSPILLVTSSGLRPDAVGALGASTSWTPEIDAFARDADWVGTAVTASSAPAVSLVSLMTGVSPWHHQVLSHAPGAPRPGVTLLAQALGDAGYQTTARVPLDYDLERYGLLEGFDQIAEIDPIEGAAELVRGLDGGQPRLIWLHLREANVAYQRRDGDLPRLAPGAAWLPPRIQAWRLLTYADPRQPLPPEVRQATWELFGHEVAWADRQVGEILSALRASGQWDHAWVILTASQGLELGEHGQALYAQNLGRESIEVPLLIKLPRSLRDSLTVPEGVRVSQPRLWATLVESAGERPGPVRAPSLFRAGETPIVSELYLRNGVNLFSILDDDLQLIWSTRFAPEEPEFYYAQLALQGGRPPLTEPARRVLGRLEAAFRHSLPFSGPDGAAPRLRLERWHEGGTVTVDDPAGAERLAVELRRRWLHCVERERTPEQESALSRPSR